MATNREYLEKKAQDDEQFARLQENLKALEDTRIYYEKAREQSIRYFDQQREDQLFREMIEKAKLDDKPLTPELRREIEAEYGEWLDDRKKALDNYKSSDGTKEIAPGTMATFDKKAAEIVEKGNVHTSVPFLNEARQLAAEKYDAFENKQAAYDLEIERATAEGDPTAAQVLEARKDYEATAYERDTAQSVLAKYEVLYGAESRNYKEQAADVEQLTAQADELYAKLEVVTDMDARMKEALQSETLMIEHLSALDAVEEEPQTEKDEARSAMMDRLRDRIEESRQEDPIEDEADNKESDIAESDLREQQADEILIENPEIIDEESDEEEKIAEERQEEEVERDSEREPEEARAAMMDRLRDRIEESRHEELIEEEVVDKESDEAEKITEERQEEEIERDLQKEREEERAAMMSRLRDRIEEYSQEESIEDEAEDTESQLREQQAGLQEEEFEADWQEFTEGDGGPPTTEADDEEARADEILRAMDEGRDPFNDGYDEFEAREAAAEEELERQAYGDPDDDAIDYDGEAQMTEDRHFNTEMPTEVEVPEEYDREFEMAPVHRYEDEEHNAPLASATISRAAITQEFSESDRERLDGMESRVDDAMERLAAAKQSGDADEITEARYALADANTDFKDYLSDRQDFKADLAEVKDDAQRLVDTDPSDRASAARDFKESYSQANQTIDRMEQEGKPWADDMRRDLQDTAQQYQQQDAEKHGDDGESGQQSVAGAAREAEGLRDNDRIVVAAPSPAVMASYQPQQTDEERERERAQH